MRYYTHIATSCAGTFALASVTDLHITPALMVGVVLGSLTPDIDEPTSKAGRKFPVLSRIIKFFFKHRGITHTLLASAVVFALLIYFLNFFSVPFAVGFSLGYLFHILGDAFSISGVPLFYPFTKKHFGIPLYETGGIKEKLIFLVSIVFLLHVYEVVDVLAFLE